MTQPDDLRERIARALYQEVLDGSNGYVEGQEANVTVDPADPEEILMVDSGVCFADLADAVIRELGLREEWLVDDVEPYDTREQAEKRKAELIRDYGDDPPAEGVPVRRRYVTDWTADERNDR